MKASLKNKESDQVDSQLKMAVDNTVSVKTPAYWESTLFSEVYLNNDLKRDFEDRWSRDYDDAVFDEDGGHVKSGFAHFYNEFRNIANTLRRTTKSGNIKETDTISKIIVPLLDALGWYDNCTINGEEPFAAESSFTVKGRGGEKDKTFRTDMLLVDDPAEAGFINDPKTSEQRKKEARNYCIAPLEAKYWNRISDNKGGIKIDKKREDKGSDDSGKSLSFNEQVLNYMDILNKKWGIVTDGNTWRLVHSDISGESPQRCFEFKIESLLSKELKIEEGSSDDLEFLENAKFFYLFFGKASYVKDDIGKIFLDEVLTESRKYIDTIEEDLKDRFISAMNITCDGLLRVAKESGAIKKATEEDLILIRTVAESHLFNILFIKSCEANNILPTKAPGYYDISLTSIIDRIKVFHPENYYKDKDYINRRLSSSLKRNRYKPDGTSLYKNLITLTEGLRDGIKSFQITGFVESIFSKEEWRFAKKHHLTDEEMVQILFQLGYSKSEEAYQADYQQIPYNYFTPRQLGSIYESFLEYKLDVAVDPMVYIKKGKYKQWVNLTAKVQKTLKGYEPIVKKGQLFFTPDNSERKATGSYYTPNYIVEFIVKETIEPLCKELSSEQILNLKICDPAMGSGHFLISALNLITRKYLDALEKETSEEYLPTLEQAKRIVLDKCIFGVDINARAVKLGKMSLWLESAHSGKKLEKLDDQLVCVNSLSTRKIWNCYPDIEKTGFDSIIGNPPYVGEKDNSKIFEELKDSSIYKYHTGKMDYWYFFVHKGLELLNSTGKLGIIATDYWVSNKGASKLREHISSNSIELYISFKDYKVFSSAKGQHNMIFILGKEKSIKCDAYFLNDSKTVKLNDLSKDLGKYTLFEKRTVDVQGAEFVFKSKDDINSLLLDGMQRAPYKLSDIANISQGFTPNPDKVNKRNIKKIPKSKLSEFNIAVGDGVFVINKTLHGRICKNMIEKKLAKPFVEANDLKNGEEISWNREKYILYTTKENCLDLKDCPHINEHLSKYKHIMNERRETLQGRREWYQLHWPKDEIFFKRAGTVSVRMTKQPIFGWSSGGLYFDLATNIIIAKEEKFNRAIFFYLQSNIVADWLNCFGKKKGSQLQVDGDPLEKIPVPDFTKYKGSLTNKNEIISFALNYFSAISSKEFVDLEDAS